MLGRFTFFVLLVLMLAAPQGVAAQGAAPQGPAVWLQMTIIDVEPAMVDEYVSLQREISTRIRRGGPAWRTVSRSDVLGDNYRFIIINPVSTLGSFDGAGRGADAELVSLNGRAQKYVRNQQTFAIRTIPELDNPLPANQAPALMMVDIAHVFPGKEQEYLTIMKSSFLPHFDKANFRHLNGTIAFGGQSGFVHLFYLQNYAKLDDKQKTGKSIRGAIGLKGQTLYLVQVLNATIPDTALVLQSMALDQALGLDGGGSSALMFQKSYKTAPGRNIPNAVLIQELP